MTGSESFLQLIKIVRFPLICLVVFSHSLGFEFCHININDLSSINIYHFVSELISHNYAKIAVCLFFFFSGYLFFRNVESFSWEWCLKKWKNRFFSLFLPFIIWNLLAVLAIVVKNGVFSLFGMYDAGEMSFANISNIRIWFTQPADFPLWFMRDLMQMVILAPIIYLFFRKTHHIGLLLLVALYISPFNPSALTMRAIFFFSLGAYLSIWNVDVLGIIRKFKVPSHFLAVATLLLATVNNGLEYHEWYLRLFYPFGMISFLNLFDSVRNNECYSNCLVKFSSSVFFIYAAHEIYILGWTKGLYLRLFGEAVPALFLRYFLVPVSVIVVCLFLYMILDRLFPKTISFICGKR